MPDVPYHDREALALIENSSKCGPNFQEAKSRPAVFTETTRNEAAKRH
jgi:hypothetical protein